MALFRNRPLVAACVLLIAIIFLSFLVDASVLILLFLLGSVTLLFLLALCLKSPMSHRRLSLLLLSAALLLAAFRMVMYHTGRERVWEDRTGTEVTAELRVKEILYLSSYGTELLCDVTVLDGGSVNQTVVLRSDTMLPFTLRDRFHGKFLVRDLGYEAYYQGAEYDYISRGASALLLLESEQDVTFLESGAGSFLASLADMRARLSYRMMNACDGEEGKLLSAVLLGTREELSPSTVRDFGRSGVMHLLALSGLHLSVLCGIFDFILRLCGARKRIRMGAVLLVSLCYLFLTGFSFSMIRAVVMLCFVFAAYLFHKDRDGVTALCFVAALVLMITPGALFSTSFQLTMLSTLGLLCILEMAEPLIARLPKGKGLRGRLYGLLRKTVTMLIVTVGACIAILPVQWLTFGEFSLLTPLANLVLIPLSTPLLFSALLLLAFPIAPVAAIAFLPARLVLIVTGWFGEMDGVLSLSYSFVAWILVPMLLLTLACLLLDLKRLRFLCGVPAVLAVIAFAICLGMTSARTQDQMRVLYYRDAGSEGFVLMHEGEAILCDLSNGSFTRLRAQYELAREQGATQASALVLTHYHEKHAISLARFCESVMVRELIVPEPITREDEEICLAIRAIADRLDIPLTVYSHGNTVPLFDSGSLVVHEPLTAERSTHIALCFTVRYGTDAFCYHTAAFSEFARHSDEQHSCTAQRVIIGVHGPAVKEQITLSHLPEEVLVCDRTLLDSIEQHEGVRYFLCPRKYELVLE